MPLPKLNIPITTIKLPSTGKNITIRPFTVKEEKILLMALESQGEEDILTSIKQIVNNCIVDDSIQFENLAYFDFEYLFLQLRIISIGNIIELGFVHTKEDCGHTNKVSVDLTEIDFKFKPRKEKDMTFMITDTIGIKVHYPSIAILLNYDDFDLTSIFSLLLDCIDYVFDSDTIFSDFTREELKDFIEGIPQSNIKGLVEFITSFPGLEKKLNFKCEKCSEDLEITLKGLKHFFV